MKRNFIASILVGLVSLAGLALLTGCDSQLDEIKQITASTSEQEGAIKTEDCRAQIFVEEGSPATAGKKFACAYQKSNTGKIMGGVCQAVEMSGSACSAAYTYQKKPWTKCASGAWLTKADMCVGPCPEHSHQTGDDRCGPDAGYHVEGGKFFVANPPPSPEPLPAGLSPVPESPGNTGFRLVCTPGLGCAPDKPSPLGVSGSSIPFFLGFTAGESASDAVNHITALGFGPAGDCTRRNQAAEYMDCKFATSGGESMVLSFYGSRLQRVVYTFAGYRYDEVLKEIQKVHGTPRILHDPYDPSYETGGREWGGSEKPFSISIGKTAFADTAYAEAIFEGTL
jgi:hypothetical protein